MKFEFVAILAAAVTVTGCASGMPRMHDADALQYADYAGAPIDRFTAFHIDGWESAGRDKLIIWTGVNEAYLLTVWDSCPDLGFVQRVGVKTIGNSITRMDAVRVGRDRCPIKEIRPLDIKQMKADRAAMKGR
jgi:hypothetical protein